MTKTTLTIDGMMCGMCESHVNDAVRGAVRAKKVSSSHKKGTCVILSEAPPEEAALRRAVEATGYRVTGFASEPYRARGLFR